MTNSQTHSGRIASERTIEAPLKLGPCPKCESAKFDATLRVVSGVYCRCGECGYLSFIEFAKVVADADSRPDVF